MQLHFYTSIPGYSNKSSQSHYQIYVLRNSLLAKNNFYHKQSMLIYGGNKTEPLNEHTSIISWKDIGDI
jgi:hypothetical protein